MTYLLRSQKATNVLLLDLQRLTGLHHSDTHIMVGSQSLDYLLITEEAYVFVKLQ